MCRTPLAVLKHLSASGESGLAASFRKSDSASGERFESTFALRVAAHRDESVADAKSQVLLDLLWGVWSGVFDGEIEELALQEMTAQTFSFLWHRYLLESTQELGAKYRAFLAAGTGGPIHVDPAATGAMMMGVGSCLGRWINMSSRKYRILS